MTKLIVFLSLFISIMSSSMAAGIQIYRDGVVTCFVGTDKPRTLECRSKQPVDTRNLKSEELGTVSYVAGGRDVVLKRIVTDGYLCYSLIGYKANAISCID